MKTIKIALLLALSAGPVLAKDIKQIRWGVDGGYPPFDVLAPNGEITGFDPDIAKAVCAEPKARCVFVKQPFDSMIAALNANKFDAVIASLNVTAERLKQVDFSDKYYASASQLVARKGSPLRPTPQSLAGKTVGVQSGSVHEQYAKANWGGGKVKIVTYANQDNVYLDLASGRIDAALQGNIQAETSFLRTERGKQFAFAGSKLGESNPVAIAVRKSDPELKVAINRAIAAIRANGVYEGVRKKYFGFDIYH
ncbi:transporter substrate-binding domain-containing protein [Chromobacterium haemolyticum]|uniref:ABC transporter substrate-binding protein n=1 Tax=Chromobacterium haemolyticum TaxID=394935 RepID=A0A1W0CTX9_9NEIS|nr:transporter substrate-binding domain-containing protein [Chromobacterium haemolyticum]OQS38247.1 ABC transporter substrate-binding protein [Chromobacterium haemolyticum]